MYSLCEALSVACSFEQIDPRAAETDKADAEWTKEEEEQWAVALKGKGGKGGKGKKGKGQGYGECWNCGEHGHPARECLAPCKLHGGVQGGGSSLASKGKGKQKGKRYGKGKGFKGKGGKGAGKRRLNLATDSEYNAAWNQGNGEDGWEYVDYGYYDNGYNHSLPQGQQWPDSRKHYSMSLTKSCKPIATGPKYFLVEMRGDDDDDEDDENVDEEETDDSCNSNCKCTDKKSKFIAKAKLKKATHGEQ